MTKEQSKFYGTFDVVEIGGTSWGNLRRKYKESANVFLLESLSKERYIATKNEKGEWIDFKDWGGNSNQEFRSYCAQEETSFLKKGCSTFGNGFFQP